MRFGGFSNHLFVNLAVGRHIDDDVAFDLGVARQTATLNQGSLAVEAALHLGERTQARRTGCQAVLGKVTLGHHHLAAATNAAAATDRINVHAQRAGGLQHGRADAKAPSAARGGEDNQRVVRFTHGVGWSFSWGGGGWCRGDHDPGRHRHRPVGLDGTCESNGRNRGRGPS